MSGTQQFIFQMRELEGNRSALTDATNEFRLKQIGVTVIEMEDVLFHLDSAVMMPDNPSGKSSTQGTPDDLPGSPGAQARKDQEAVSGLRALALVYKQFEFDPDKRLVVAGHTDTSGEPKYNFELSEARALNVLYLLTVEREAWAENSAKKHRVEDFQQIMKYFYSRTSYDCDPGKVNNAWGSQTDKATENFLRGSMDKSPDSEQIDATLKTIRATHTWPVAAWRAVFDLYMGVLAEYLQVKPGQMRDMAGCLSFVDDDKRIVGCGESFPIDERQKTNFRSQTNRRVEMLLFDKDDAPLLDCPLKVNGQYPNKVHTSEECPLYDKLNIVPLYIDPLDLFAVAYHVRFVYYDRVREALTDVPPGLRIQTYSSSTDTIPTVTVVRNGIYFIKVQFSKPAKELEIMNMRFRFSTSDQWIFTESKTASPRIVTLPQADYDKLGPADQAKHYRIPSVWNSNGLYARYKGPGGGVTNDDIMEGRDTREFFKFLFTRYFAERKPKYKPFGDDVTTPGTPIVLCLDDIVLTSKDLVATGGGKMQGALLDKDLAVLYPDTGSHQSYYSQGQIDPVCLPFSKTMVLVRAILYGSGLYALYDDRMTSTDGTGPHDGMRAATKGRPPHCTLQEHFNQEMPEEETGNSDLYLLRDWGTVNDEAIACLFMHLRWEFQGVQDPGKPTDPPFNVAPEWIETTVKNITGFWNNRTQAGMDQLTALTSKDAAGKKRRILIRYYLEPVKADRHTLIKVFPAGTNGRSNMGVSTGELRASDNEPNKETRRFTAAHEFGHATSLSDEYVENSKDASYLEAGFKSYTPGSPYDFDRDADMVANKEVRARYYWHLAEWVASVEGGGASYTVEQGNYRYQIAPYPKGLSPRIRTYHSYPVVEMSVVNRPSPRAKYDVVLNLIGQDDFGKGDRPGSLAPGHVTDGLLLVLLKMKINFIETNDFWAIRNTLSAIDRKIKRTFNYRDDDHQGKWYFRGRFSGSPAVEFSKCALLFFPRFLVPNFPGPKDSMVEDYARDVEVYQEDANKKFDYVHTSREYTKVVTALEGMRHFDVFIKSAGVFEKHSAAWDSPQGRKLTLTTGWFTDADELLAAELPRMIGIEKKAEDVTAADLLHVADGILLDASIDRF